MRAFQSWLTRLPLARSPLGSDPPRQPVGNHAARWVMTAVLVGMATTLASSQQGGASDLPTSFRRAPLTNGPGPSVQRSRAVLACIGYYGGNPDNTVLSECSAERPTQLPDAVRRSAATASPSSARSAPTTTTRTPIQSTGTASRPSPPPRATAATPSGSTPPGRITMTPANAQRSPAPATATNRRLPIQRTATLPYDPRSRVQAMLSCIDEFGGSSAANNAVLSQCQVWAPGSSDNIPADAAPEASRDRPAATGFGAGFGLNSRGSSGTSGGSTERSGSASSASGGRTGTSGGPTNTTPRSGSNGSVPRTSEGSSTPTASSTNQPAPIVRAVDDSPAPVPTGVAASSSTANSEDDFDVATADLEDVGVHSSSDASRRGRVSENFDSDRLRDYICYNFSDSFNQRFELCEGDIAQDNGDSQTGSGAAQVGNAIALSCSDTEADLRARGAIGITTGSTTFYAGFTQVAATNQNPVLARFDNGQQTWCRDDYETTRDDSRGYGLVWDGGDRLYAAFSVTGTQGTPDQDFRRFATTGWLNSYGLGGGPQVAVIAQVDPNTGNITTASFLSALQSNGTSNTLRVTELALQDNGLFVRAESAFSPRRSDRTAFSCQDGLSGFDYRVTFTDDLGSVTTATADRCS